MQRYMDGLASMQALALHSHAFQIWKQGGLRQDGSAASMLVAALQDQAAPESFLREKRIINLGWDKVDRLGDNAMKVRHKPNLFKHRAISAVDAACRKMDDLLTRTSMMAPPAVPEWNSKYVAKKQRAGHQRKPTEDPDVQG